MNKGCDILRDQFTPETAIGAIHNILSMLTQSVSDDVDDRLVVLNVKGYKLSINNSGNVHLILVNISYHY